MHVRNKVSELKNKANMWSLDVDSKKSSDSRVKMSNFRVLKSVLLPVSKKQF